MGDFCQKMIFIAIKKVGARPGSVQNQVALTSLYYYTYFVMSRIFTDDNHNTTYPSCCFEQLYYIIDGIFYVFVIDIPKIKN